MKYKHGSIVLEGPWLEGDSFLIDLREVAGVHVHADSDNGPNWDLSDIYFKSAAERVLTVKAPISILKDWLKHVRQVDDMWKNYDAVRDAVT